MRKLSFEENLRHRLRDVKRLGQRDRSSSIDGMVYLGIGAAVGIAAGIFLAQKYGGFGAITSRIADRKKARSQGAEQPGRRGDHGREHLEGYDAHDYAHDTESEGWDSVELASDELSATEELEERVLEAYRNDPVLSERAIDIGALDIGIIELTGWVHSPDESKHAVTIARGTPGVDTVLNRLAVRDDEEWFSQHAARYGRGDASLAQGQWDTPNAAREAPDDVQRAD